MYTLLIIALWSMGLLILFLFIYWGKGSPIRPFHLAGVCLIILALVLRLLPNILTPSGANYDIQSYKIIAELAHNGNDIYQETAGENRYPYLPFWLYWLSISHTLNEETGLPFHSLVKLFPILADAVLAWLIFHHVRTKKSFQDGFKAGLLYAVNPISIFVVAFHGQFDSLPLLFLVASCIAITNHPPISGVLLGMGILIKSWPVLGFPSLVISLTQWRSRIIFTIGAIMIPALGILVYCLDFGGDPFEIIQRAIGYNRGIGVWGYSYLLRMLCQLFDIDNIYKVYIHISRYITIFGISLVWWLKARHEKGFNSLLTVFLTFFCLTHAFAIQYLIWLIPFGLITGQYKWTMRYILASFSYMFLVYFTLILHTSIENLLPLPLADLYIIIPASLPIWFVTIGWLISHLQQRNITQISEIA